MSEFKYACPVCSQHIKCDSSQAGTVMDCPTCFQKIIAPQAPADGDQKLILTGTKVSDRPPQKTPEANPYAATQVKGSSGAVVVIIILAFIGAAVAFVYRGTIFKPKAPAATTNAVATAVAGETHETVAPDVSAASDTNWTLNPAAMNISGTNVTGRIHGQDFTAVRVALYNGTLYFRADEHGPVTFGVTINFSGAAAAALSGKTINVTTNANKAARVMLHWKNDGVSGKESFESGYALRLEFGSLTNNHLPGKIFLCTADDEKSYLVGNFNAEAHRVKAKAVTQ